MLYNKDMGTELFVPRIRIKKGSDNYGKEMFSMQKYECPCGYVYDPELGDPDNGVAPGTAWEDVPEDWVCPTCGLGKDEFYAVD